MPRQSFFDELTQGFGNAVADIRQKVVEEPMYGRAVTDRDAAPEWPPAQEPEQAFGSSTHSREMEPTREQAQDMDLDR
jgi:hypothetical protein